MQKLQTTLIITFILIAGMVAYFSFPLINRSNQPEISLETLAGDEQFAKGYTIEGYYEPIERKASYAYPEGKFRFDTTTGQIKFPTKIQSTFAATNFKRDWENPSLYRGLSKSIHKQAESSTWFAVLTASSTYEKFLHFRVQNKQTDTVTDFSVDLSTAPIRLEPIYKSYQLYVDDKFLYVIAPTQFSDDDSFSTSVLQISIEAQKVIKVLPLIEPTTERSVGYNFFSYSFSESIDNHLIAARTFNEDRVNQAASYVTVLVLDNQKNKKTLEKILYIDLESMSIKTLNIDGLPPLSHKLNAYQEIYMSVDENIAYIYLQQHLYVLDLEQNQLLLDLPVAIPLYAFTYLKIVDNKLAILGKDSEHKDNKLAIYDLATGKELYLGKLAITNEKFDYGISYHAFSLHAK